MRDLSNILKQLDTLMQLRPTQDEASTLIVEALHHISDKLSGPGLTAHSHHLADDPPGTG